MDGLDGERDSSFGDIRRFEQYKREDSKPVPSSLGTSTSRRTKSTNEVVPNLKQTEIYNLAPNSSPVGFHTADADH